MISGKGGTGKTSITGCLAALAGKNLSNLPVLVDCDVDAPNLHLLLGGTEICREPFAGPKLAVIDQTKIIDPNRLEKSCRFDAIKGLEIDPSKCVGCGVCQLVCGSEAVKMVDREAAVIFERDTSYGRLFHGRLHPGRSAFGGLITALRMKGEQLAVPNPGSLLLLDGSPGLGCQVISSLTGCDLALLVTEPGLGALGDLERICSLLRFFKIKTMVIINRYDIDRSLTGDVERFCRVNDITVAGKLPYDNVFLEAEVASRPAVELAGLDLNHRLDDIYQQVIGEIYE